MGGRRRGPRRWPAQVSLKLSVAVLTQSEPSLTNADAVLLSHDVCTAMIRTHKYKCGLDRDSRAKLAALFNGATEYVLARCSHLARRSRTAGAADDLLLTLGPTVAAATVPVA